MFARLSRLLGVVLVLCASCSEPDVSVKLDYHAVPTQRAKVRAFYSGHSLTDGVPEEIAKMLAAPTQSGLSFDFDFQSGGGALIAMRSLGLDPSQPGAGYRFGRNRNGEGMDVVAEWRAPRTLAPGDRYNVLVITERNSLPWSLHFDRTVPALTEYADKFATESGRGSESGDVLLYHVWLAIGDGPIEAWLEYEHAAEPLWECLASKVNRTLPAGRSKIRVLPGATALADFVESVVDGRAPGITGTERERLALIFSDNVHLAPLGLYFMGLVHYAALFGQSPEGAAATKSAPEGVSPELARYMQQRAWLHVLDYAHRAEAAAARDMAWCRSYAAEVMCPRYYQFLKPAGGSLIDRAKFMKQAFLCADGFEDLDDPLNPFRD